MGDAAVIWEWVGYAARWIHVIMAMAWIGTSFYFIALDLGLRKLTGAPDGAQGEAWHLQDGRFYHIRQHPVAPMQLPEHLTWFKWESYWTWLSGFVLLVVVYYFGADIYLVDPAVAELANWQAISISLVSLVLGWVVYDLICKSAIGTDDTRLMLALFAILVALAWFYAQVFSGRAALLHLGAFTATIMTANIAHIIVPQQRMVVADLKAGRTPDPEHGQLARQRSTHNTYLTLPVIFMMLSTHYPLAFATEYNWIIASLIFLMGVILRHYALALHARKGKLRWTWGVALVLFAAIVWLSALGSHRAEPSGTVHLTPRQQAFAQAAGFDTVHDIVRSRCAMCHSAEPLFGDLRRAPKGVLLETRRQIAAHATGIYLHSGRTRAMPPANISFMEPQERDAIIHWFESAERG